MKFDLEAMARRKTNKRDRTIDIRPIITTQAQAQSLALVYLRVIGLIKERTPRLLSIYGRTIEQTLQTDTINEIGQELDSIDAALQRLVLELNPSLRLWAMRTEEWHQGKWKRAVLDAVSIELETLIGSEDMRETIEAWLLRNTGLIRNISDEARGKIGDAVFRGFQRRATAVEMAKEIREVVGMSRARAIRIAGDQTVKLASALDAERQRQGGLDEWKWRHSGKLHFRPEHKARNGNLYNDETEPEDLPGELPYCGCVRQAVLNL